MGKQRYASNPDIFRRGIYYTGRPAAGGLSWWNINKRLLEVGEMPTLCRNGKAPAKGERFSILHLTIYIYLPGNIYQIAAAMIDDQREINAKWKMISVKTSAIAEAESDTADFK